MWLSMLYDVNLNNKDKMKSADQKLSSCQSDQRAPVTTYITFFMMI